MNYLTMKGMKKRKDFVQMNIKTDLNIWPLIEID